MFTERDAARTTLHLTILFTIAGSVFGLARGLGFLLGGLISFLALRLMTLDGTKMLKSSAQGLIDIKQAKRYSWRSYLKRCSLYTAALSISLIRAELSFATTFAGLLLPRLAIILLLIRGRFKRGA